MRRRRGRPRKTGRRYPSGDRVKPAVSPREIAAGMPHRRGLGELATDQRAETELGRLVLRGVLDETLGLAGETYLALWRGYVFSLAGPRELSNGGGHGFSCGGCSDAEARRWCRCEFRKRIYLEAARVLTEVGPPAVFAVEHVVLDDGLCLAGSEEGLRLGLSALAHHFGLTPRANSHIGKSSIANRVPS
jgi:hypothetical protein